MNHCGATTGPDANGVAAGGADAPHARDQQRRPRLVARLEPHRHLELFYAVPDRRRPSTPPTRGSATRQIAFTINHAGSRSCSSKRTSRLVARLQPRLPESSIRAARDAYENLIAAEDGDSTGRAWTKRPQHSSATPRAHRRSQGCALQHRSIVLHAMAAGLSSASGSALSTRSCPARRCITRPPGACLSPPRSRCKLVLRATGWTAPAAPN